MNRLILQLALVTVLVSSCAGPSTPKREIHNKDFNWTITIPEGFQNVSAKESAQMREKGTEAIEETADAQIIDQTTNIFEFKSDQLNHFESSWQPFDIAVDGDYLVACKEVNDLLYQTFTEQMPGTKIDTAASVERIDHLDFRLFKIKIEYPNKKVLTAMMYCRLFGKKELAVNISYVDEEKGQAMLDAWRQSKFNH